MGWVWNVFTDFHFNFMCIKWNLKTHSPFPPPNSYVVQVCNKTNVTPFKIVAKNEERGQPEASYVRSVKVELPGDTVVELHKGRRVLVWSFLNSLFHLERFWRHRSHGKMISIRLRSLFSVVAEWKEGENTRNHWQGWSQSVNQWILRPAGYNVWSTGEVWWSSSLGDYRSWRILQ